MKRMILCSACKRHVFAAEHACPFCGAGVASSHSSEPAVGSALSRAERYAIGAAVALTFAATGCSKSEEPAATPEAANQVEAASSANAPPEVKPPEPTRVEEPARAEEAPPASPFLVDSPLATTSPPPPDPTTTTAKLPVTATTTARKPPPPPPPDDSFEGPGGVNNHWRGQRKCIRQPNGGMSCPPYGCVFPDEACDVLRV